MRGRAIARVGLLIGLIGVLLVACGRGSPTVTSSSMGPPSPSGSVVFTIWMAGVATAADPNDLDARYAELEPSLGSALEVGPGTCYEGQPPPFSGPKYLLVVIADSKEALDSALSDAGVDALFESEATRVCVD